jgi:hypothetical protein
MKAQTFLPGKRPDTHCMGGGGGGLQGPSGWMWKILPRLGFEPWTVQPVVSCYPGHLTIRVIK